MKIYKVKFQVPFLMMHHGGELYRLILRSGFPTGKCSHGDRVRALRGL